MVDLNNPIQTRKIGQKMEADTSNIQTGGPSPQVAYTPTPAPAPVEDDEFAPGTGTSVGDEFAADTGTTIEDEFAPGTGVSIEDEFAPGTGSALSEEPSVWDSELKGEMIATVRPSELDAIAKKFGAKRSDLEEYLGWIGGQELGNETSAVTDVAGFLQESLLLGVPGWLRKKSEDENTQKAMDAVKELVRDRQGWGRIGADIATGVAASLAGGAGVPKLAATLSKAGVKLFGKQVAKKAATELGEEVGESAVKTFLRKPTGLIGSGATVGGLTGLSESQTDKEIQGFLTGAVIGGALTGSIVGAGKVASYAWEHGGRTTWEKGMRGLMGDRKVTEALDDNIGYLHDEAEKLLVSRAADYDTLIARVGDGLHEIDDEAAQWIAYDAIKHNKKYAEVLQGNAYMNSQLGNAKKVATQRINELKRSAMEIENLHIYKSSQRLHESKRAKFDADSAKEFDKLAEEAPDKAEELLKRAFYREAIGELDPMKSINNGKLRLRDRVFLWADGDVVAREAADRTQLPIDIYMSNASRGESLSRNMVAHFTKKGEKALKEIKKSGVFTSDEELGRALDTNKIEYQDLATGKWRRKKLSKEQTEAIKPLRELFEDIRQTANRLAEKTGSTARIDKREVFFPHIKLAAPQLTHKMRTAYQELKTQTGIDFITDLHPAIMPEIVKTQAGKTLLNGMKMSYNKMGKISIKDADEAAQVAGDFKKIFLDMKDENFLDSDAFVAGATKQREGVMPKEFIDFNPSTNLPRYLYSTFHNIIMEQPFNDLKTVSRILGDKGDKMYGGWIDKQLAGMMGHSTGLARDWKSFVHKSEIARMEAMDEFKARYGVLPKAASLSKAAISSTPNLIHLMMNNAYPAFLSYSPKSVVQNLSQPVGMTMPEVGYVYAAKKLPKMAMDFAKLQSAIDFKLKVKSEVVAHELGVQVGEEVSAAPHKRLRLWLENEEISTGTLSAASLDTISREISMGAKAAGASKSAVATVNEVGMSMFAWSEMVARYYAARMGQELAQDAVKGSMKDFNRVVNKMSRGFREKANNLLAAAQEGVEGADVDLRKLMGQYVTEKTAFNYTTAAQSAGLRQMGKVFGQFTKWPVSIAGDAAYDIRKLGWMQGTMKQLHKRMWPLGLLMAGERMLEETMDKEQKEALFGKGGMSSLAPAYSPFSLLSGQSFAPPVFGPAQRALEQKSWTPLAGYQVFTVPGYGLIRGLTVDGPMLLGEKTAIRRGQAVTDTLGLTSPR